MAFKKNKVKADLGSYPYFMLLAPKKFGKTTFWSRLVPVAWGDEDKGLLISCGREEGYKALEDLQYEEVKVWSGKDSTDPDARNFIEVIDDIVENNEEYGLKGVCIDTLDTFVDIATKEVLRLHYKEKKTKCKSLNDAFGGFNRGVLRLYDVVDEQLNRLRSLGISVWFLCHTKNKEKTDMLSGDKYEMITNNLQSNIYDHFANSAQMVMVGVIDRQINNGKILNEERVIHLRGTSEIDAGSRFNKFDKDVIGLDPEEFMEAFKSAVKNQINDSRKRKAELNGEEYKDISDNELEAMKKVEQEKAEQDAKIFKEKDAEAMVDTERNEELYNIVKVKLPQASTEKQMAVKEFLISHEISKFDINMSTKLFEEAVQLLD